MAELEGLINRATNPNNVYEDWKAIVSLCDYLSKESQAIPNAVRLLSHKMQSPQEKEALCALRTLEACVQRCGPKFHTEIGKFRFLNEMIKMLSPKYLGSRTSETVKRRVTEILRNWNTQMKSETKIADAYAMLQRNGFIREAPAEDGAGAQPKSSSSKPTDQPLKKKVPSIFEDDEKSKTLASLLKSRNPADLVAANRLIKTMLKEDAELQDRQIKRDVELETVGNNIKLLTEMLNSFEASGGGPRASELEIVRELQSTLQRARPQLVKLASETDERDTETVSMICKLGDDVTNVLARCATALSPRLLDGVEVSAEQPATASASGDLLTLGADLNANSLADFTLPPPLPPPPSAEPPTAGAQPSLDVTLLDLDFGFTPAASQPPPPPPPPQPSSNAPLPSDTNSLLSDIFSGSTSGAPNTAATPVPAPQPSFVPPPRAGGYTSLAALKTGTPTAPPPQPAKLPSPQHKPTSPFAELEFLQKTSLTKPQAPLTSNDWLKPMPLPPTSAPLGLSAAPKRVTVSETRYLEYAERSGQHTRPCATCELLPALHIDVQDVVPSSSIVSKCVLDCEKVRVMLHFTDNRPEPAGSRLLVLALTNYNPSRVHKVELGCSTLVKLESTRLADAEPQVDCEPPVCAFQCAAFRVLPFSTSNQLAAFNPLVPPATATYALHVARASSAYCVACQREPDAPGRCLKLRLVFEVQNSATCCEQLVNLADFI